jgi:hypothetical protein
VVRDNDGVSGELSLCIFLLPIVAVASLVLWTEEARKLFVRIRSASASATR